MNEESNLQIIREHLSAFGSGNIEKAISFIADTVDWQSPASRTQPVQISWAKPRNSPNEVKLFFQELSEHVIPGKFEILGFTAQGDRVIVEGSNSGKIRSTGKSYEHDWVMIFTIKNGKIVRHRHYYDTADILHAL